MLINSRDYRETPAPTISGVEEPNIVANVGKIINLSIERKSKGKNDFSILVDCRNKLLKSQ